MSRRKPTVAKAPPPVVVPTVRTVAIDSLIPDAGNVRRRDARATATLEASLRQFGPARSIVVDGKGIVRAGNGTLEAAQAAGSTEVLVVRPGPGQVVAVERADWSPTEATAYAIGDNRTSELATWDAVGLVEQLRSLQSEDFDLGNVGFSVDELDALNERIGTDLLDAAPPDDFPEKDETIQTDHLCPKCGYAWSGKTA
jgi:ParB-like chromosome segregation protein Spo0J